ncbi:hypothetical protein, partial [Alkalihalobacillus alcalophilus]|uniref:hypothetical protein n=1 Tax=Alkalihalobacillus alcalophilus TaxID=1445 RepID=UPI001F42BB76
RLSEDKERLHQLFLFFLASGQTGYALYLIQLRLLEAREKSVRLSEDKERLHQPPLIFSRF